MIAKARPAAPEAAVSQSSQTIVKVCVGIKPIVSREVINRAVKVVATVPGNESNGPTTGPAYLSGIVLGKDFEFFDRIDGRG